MQSDYALWTLAIDLDGDQAFAVSDAIPLTDIISVEWSLGLDPYQSLARSARATITFDNSQGKYSPEHANALSGFTVGKAVQLSIANIQYAQVSGGEFLRSTNGYALDGTAHSEILFTLKIASIEPAPGQYRDRRTVVKCEDNLNRARNYPLKVATQLNKTADELIAIVLAASNLYPPAYTAWLLGVPGRSELGLTTILTDSSIGTELDAGDITFPYAFDNNADAATLYDALRYIVDNERGRLFCNRDGNWEFWRRNRLTSSVTVDYVLNDRMVGLDYEYGGDVANAITVTYNPRYLDETGTPTLGTINSAFSIPAGASRSIDVRFVDSNGNRISTTDAITPVATTDYTANSAEDGAGVDYTTSVSVSMEPYSQSARLTFTNNASVTVWVQEGSKIRGNNTLTDFGDQDLYVEDADSIALYDRYPLSVDLRLMNSADAAYDAAQFILNQRKDPQGVARDLAIAPLLDDAFLTLALNDPIGKRITLIETQTGHEADYFIIGESHRISGGAASNWTTSLVIEPAPTSGWLLGVSGYSELGETTILI